MLYILDETTYKFALVKVCVRKYPDKLISSIKDIKDKSAPILVLEPG
jgi:hypothetical protein